MPRIIFFSFKNNGKNIFLDIWKLKEVIASRLLLWNIFLKVEFIGFLHCYCITLLSSNIKHFTYSIRTSKLHTPISPFWLLQYYMCMCIFIYIYYSSHKKNDRQQKYEIYTEEWRLVEMLSMWINIKYFIIIWIPLKHNFKPFKQNNNITCSL